MLPVQAACDAIIPALNGMPCGRVIGTAAGCRVPGREPGGGTSPRCLPRWAYSRPVAACAAARSASWRAHDALRWAFRRMMTAEGQGMLPVQRVEPLPEQSAVQLLGQRREVGGGDACMEDRALARAHHAVEPAHPVQEHVTAVHHDDAARVIHPGAEATDVEPELATQDSGPAPPRSVAAPPTGQGACGTVESGCGRGCQAW